MAGNIFRSGFTSTGDILDAGEKGWQDTQSRTDTIQKKSADYKAAPLIASGNFAGAAQAYGAAGMPEQARANVVDQQVMTDRADATQKAQAAAKLDAMAKLTDAVQAVPEGQRQAWLQAQLPALKQMGLPADQMSQLDESHLSDSALAPWKAALGKAKLEFQKVGNDVLAIDSGTGHVKNTYRGPITVKKDENIFAPDDPGYGGTPAGAAPQAAPAAPTLAAAPTPVTTPPAPNKPVFATIAKAAQASGGKAEELPYLARLAQVESSGNPNARNGKSTGIYQFHPDTFAGVGGTNINDVGDQTKAVLNLSRRDRGILQAQGIEPNDANTYIMHQQGAAGGLALLKASPSVNAITVLTPVYGSAETARKAILNNGGTADMTAGQFVDRWRQRWSGAKPPAQQSAAPAAADDTPTATAPKGYHLLASGPTDPEEAALSDSAVKLQAGMYLKTGQMPPLGMGKTAHADRVRIMNQMDATAKELGLSADDIVSGSVSLKAASKGLEKATAIRSQVEGSEATVNKNAQLMLNLAPRGGGPTGMPVLNRVIQHIRGQYAGDPDVSAFEVALGTVADEYAKVMTTNTGTGGATSDSARQEAYSRLSKASTADQLKSVIATMQTEMQNRATSLRDVEEGLRSQVRGTNSAAPPALPPTPAPAAPRVRKYNPQTGRIE